MDWETLYCPNPDCVCYGVRYGESRLVKNGSSRGHRPVLCQACGRRISVRYGTAYSELEADSCIFELAFRALAEGNSLRGTARIVEID